MVCVISTTSCYLLYVIIMKLPHFLLLLQIDVNISRFEVKKRIGCITFLNILLYPSCVKEEDETTYRLTQHSQS
jgi:hypothetical protein